MPGPYVPSWVQGAMFSSNVTELTLTMGFIAEPQHFQWQLELRNPIDQTLLDLQAMPAGYPARWGAAWLELGWLAEQMLITHYGKDSMFGRAQSLRERLESLGIPPPRSADPFP